MSDWTYEPLIVKLKAALAEAEVESEGEGKAPPARSAPRADAAAGAPRRDSEPDLQRS
jgi:hypothetical protein